VEATKKTSTTKTALLVVAALSMLLSGLFIATASRSDANPAAACPDGFALTADAKNCFQAAAITSADNPNSCDKGQLTPDGSKCYVAARVIPQEGATLCPKGYSPDDSLGGMCARFEAAPQRAAACPDGSRGVTGGCYILVAKGPRGDAACATGTLAGTNCVITGNPPVNGAATCPESATVLSQNGECFTLVAPANQAGNCDSSDAYNQFGSVCKALNPNGADPDTAGDFTCPAVAGQTVTPTMHTVGGINKIASCSYPLEISPGACEAPLTPNPGTGLCRRKVDLRPGPAACAAGFGIVGGACIRYTSPAASAPQCPIGSVEDSVGDCRKPVADAAGAYYCADANAALNGKSCVYTSGFLIEPTETLYKCDEGVRTVIGSGSAALGTGSAVQVICLLGDANANTSTSPSCLQGVPSADAAYCLVPRIDTAPAAAVAAPVPSFTG